MARTTEFSGASSRFGATIRQSLDLITGRNVNSYSLLFLDPTKQYKRGESKNIVMPYIVLGRGASCHVQYGDKYPTVSRQHAAIQADDQGYTLIHNPQATNPTYVDGQPVQGAYPLKSGDEIQLSQNGPRIRFLVDKAVSSSTMGFTRRMSLAIGQALVPYRRALMIAGVLLMSVIGYSAWSSLKVSRLQSAQGDLSKELSKADSMITVYTDEISQIGIRTTDNTSRIDSARIALAEANKWRNDIYARMRHEDNNSTNVSKLLEDIENSIYYIHVLEFKLDGTHDMFDEANDLMGRWSGTGFLADDGRFYTARHVVEPWIYPEMSCDILSLVNNYISKGGSVFIKFIAISPSGDSFTFTGEQVISDPSRDEIEAYDCDDGEEISVRVPRENGMGYRGTDYAYVVLSNMRSNIHYDRKLSVSLDRGERLFIHGYPGGLHLQDGFKLNPVYSEAILAQKGTTRGALAVTAMSFVGGNSGGPVFALRNNKLVVVGIAVATFDKVGLVVPAANFR